jgi:UPF0755 protein
MRIDFKNLLTRWQIILVGIVFIGLIAIAYLTFFTPNYFPHKEPVQFDIENGETFASVVNRLYELEMIPSKTNMKIAAFISGSEKKIRAARFHIKNGLSYLNLLDLFTEGKCDFSRKISLKDGQTIKWLAYKLEKQVFIDSANFVSLSEDPIYLAKLGFPEKTLEGYLFSKEYDVYERSSPEEAIKMFYNSFIEFWVDSLESRAAEFGFSKHEILTLASIVKGETDLQEEMPRIAGVYHNRLRIGMRLQADPTIQYLLPGGWRKLLYDDLQINSPYNTYKYAGLPPGPINNPGKDAILAALYPEVNEFLYFVADGKGKHNFSKTYNQHLRYVREYRRFIRSQDK